MALDLEYKKGQAKASSYQPTGVEQEVLCRVRKDYTHGHALMNTPLEEFNHLSIIEQINEDRKSFNAYVEPRSDNPDESWRAQTIRPIVRAKLISIAAHVVANMIVPKVFAQNEKDDEDKAASEIFGDLMEWAIHHSNYERTFVNAIITALVDPIVYVHQDFKKIMRTVKRMSEDGTYTKEEMLDEVLSGFQSSIMPAQDVYFSDLREPDIQKQRFIIYRKNISYDVAEELYGDHENFKYVRPGIQTFYVDGEATFYDQQDGTLKDGQVEVVTYWNRLKDMEVVLVNGVLVTSPEACIRRYDKRYPIAKTGYEPINDGQFFVYKSAANKIGYDEELINQLYNYVMDGTFLALMPPLAMYGDEDIDGPSVMIPGAVTPLDTESRVEQLNPRSDLRGGMEAINMVERSVAESTQDAFRGGVAQSGERTAFEVATLEQNAKTQLGLFGKFIGFFVQDLGTLLLGDIIEHITVSELNETTSMTNPLKYKNILVPDRIKDGKKFTRKIEMSDDMLGSEEMDQETLMDKSYELLNKEGKDGDMRIAKVNPALLRKMKTSVTVSPDQLQPRSKSLEKAMKLEVYDRAIGNPTVEIESVTRDFLFEPFDEGSSDKYIKQQQQPNPLSEQYANSNGAYDAPQGVAGNLTRQITGSNSLKNAQMME
jgi:hypothetical protein